MYPVLKPEPESSLHEDKIYLVTHGNISAGYQTAQIAHVIAELIINNPDIAHNWHHVSNSLIVVEVKTAEELMNLKEKVVQLNETYFEKIIIQEFREPDIGDEITAIAFAPHPYNRKILSNYPLAGKKLHNQKELHDREKTLRKLSYAMMDCEQTKGQTILEHGRSVREHYFALLEHLHGRISLTETSNWRIPAWVNENKEFILQHLPSTYIMDRYLTLHDCGKPAIREVDEEGKVHFPNHAEKSAQTYRDMFGAEANETVAYLIEHDMDAHMLKAVDVEPFSHHPTAIAQMLAALAEVTANAAMFGGIESTSFKIKFKQINQRGNALIKLLSEK